MTENGLYILVGAVLIVVVFTIAAFASMLISSRLLVDVQGTPFGAKMQEIFNDAQRGAMKSISYSSVQDSFGAHPFNQGVWDYFIKHAADLPPASQGRVRKLKLLRRIQYGVLGIFFAGWVAAILRLI